MLPFGSRHALHILERNRLVYRHEWMVIFTGFFEPLFYLLGIGFGLGSLIGNVTGPGWSADPLRGVRRARAAGHARHERRRSTTRPTCSSGCKYEKTYDGMLATPLSVGDMALGEITWALTAARCTASASWS